MKWMKRAIVHLYRNLSKTFLIIFIIFIIGNMLFIGFSMKSTATSLSLQMKNQLGAKVTYTNSEINNKDYFIETEKDLKRFKDYENTIVKLIRNSHVKYGGYSYMVYLHDYNNLVCYGYGVSQTIIDLQENKIRLVSGRKFTQNEIDQGAYVTIVSKEFLEENKKQINETIKMNISYSDTVCNELGCNEVKVYEEEYELKIIGIFEKIDKAFDINNTDFNAIQNRMYLPNKTLWKIFERKKELNNKYEIFEFDYIAIDFPFIRLNNTEELDDFENEVKTWLPKNDQEKLITSNDEFLKISSQVKILEKIGIMLIAGSIISFIFILIILMFIAIKERLREIGILLMLGESKFRLMVQIIVENLLMNVIGIFLSLISGNFIWNILNRYIFQIENIKITSFNIQIMLISIIVVLLSMIYPIIKIMTIKVKKILLD